MIESFQGVQNAVARGFILTIADIFANCTINPLILWNLIIRPHIGTEFFNICSVFRCHYLFFASMLFRLTLLNPAKALIIVEKMKGAGIVWFTISTPI